jgi:endogenous inhibitor of DNA gyrase (YacG/DUF329 family)
MSRCPICHNRLAEPPPPAAEPARSTVDHERPAAEPLPPAPEAQRPAFAPFCSERCKLVDLGRWLGEGYRIPAEGSGLGDLDDDTYDA